MNERNQSNDLHSLSCTKWDCIYHVIFRLTITNIIFVNQIPISELLLIFIDYIPDLVFNLNK